MNLCNPRSRSRRRLAIAGLAAAWLLSLRAADTSYLGIWKIASAVPAPWANPNPPDSKEMKSLTGKTLVFRPGAIEGPGILGCKGPHYRVVDVPAEGLFQGAFEEMHSKDAKADPRKLAEKVGFQGTHWKSLQTGCANELDFHFLDPATAAFGLNDWVYTIRKQ